MIGNSNQVVALALHHGKRVVELGFLLWMLCNIAVNLLPGDAVRIESATRRKRIFAHKWLVFF